MAKIKLELLLLFCLTVHYSMNEFVNSHGLGTKYIWAEDTDMQHPGTDDVIFSERDNPNFSIVKSDFENILKRLRVEVVDPGKHLIRVMNTISTKSRAMFFQEYEHYYETLNVGSTSRPMLLSYLGLKFVDQDQLQSWYAPLRVRARPQIVDSCKSLLDTRRKSLNLSDKDLEVIAECKSRVKSKFHLAYLVFQNNLNLFMLDSYLLLCKRLEPDNIEINDDSLALQ